MTATHAEIAPRPHRSIDLGLMPWGEWVDGRGRVWIYASADRKLSRAGWRIAAGPVPQVRLDRWVAAPHRVVVAPLREAA